MIPAVIAMIRGAFSLARASFLLAIIVERNHRRIGNRIKESEKLDASELQIPHDRNYKFKFYLPTVARLKR